MSSCSKEANALVNTGTLAICQRSDVIRARQFGCDTAQTLGFGLVDQRRLATAISEVTRNILQHSGAFGTMSLEVLERDSRCGLLIIVEDHGCGIDGSPGLLADEHSTSVTQLGAGIPSCKRLMDECEIVSGLGRGTLVRMTIWLSKERPLNDA
jgi:serine/threonine-protein kinase RsbT